MSSEDITYAFFANAKQISTQYIEKKKRTEKDTWRLFYYPFFVDTGMIQRLYIIIEEQISNKRYDEAVSNNYFKKI